MNESSAEKLPGRDRHVGAPVELVRDRLAAHASAHAEAPQLLARLRVERERVAVQVAGEDHAARGAERAAAERERIAVAPCDLAGRDVDRREHAVRLAFLRVDVSGRPPRYGMPLVYTAMPFWKIWHDSISGMNASPRSGLYAPVHAPFMPPRLLGQTRIGRVLRRQRLRVHVGPTVGGSIVAQFTCSMYGVARRNFPLVRSIR